MKQFGFGELERFPYTSGTPNDLADSERASDKHC